jgi:hypothetical protein
LKPRDEINSNGSGRCNHDERFHFKENHVELTMFDSRSSDLFEKELTEI